MTKAYKQWHTMLPHLPRLSRYTLGVKIDNQFITICETLLIAGFTGSDQKRQLLKQASVKLDLLKWLLQTAWEMKVMSNGQYSQLAPLIVSAGKMIGGWIKDLEQRSPSR